MPSLSSTTLTAASETVAPLASVTFPDTVVGLAAWARLGEPANTVRASSTRGRQRDQAFMGATPGCRGSWPMDEASGHGRPDQARPRIGVLAKLVQAPGLVD